MLLNGVQNERLGGFRTRGVTWKASELRVNSRETLPQLLDNHLISTRMELGE